MCEVESKQFQCEYFEFLREEIKQNICCEGGQQREVRIGRGQEGERRGEREMKKIERVEE